MSSVGTATGENRMTAAELEGFLREPKEARLATIRADGDVHLTPVWFVQENEVLRFCLEARRLHLRNLRRRPRATLLIDVDDRPRNGWKATAKGAMFTGPTTLIDDHELVETFRARLRERYYGDDVHTPEYKATAGAYELAYTLVELHSERQLTWDFSKA